MASSFRFGGGLADTTGDFASIGGAVYATFAPWVSWLPGGNPSGVLANLGSVHATSITTTGSTVAVTSGGITIDLLFDAAAMAAPQSFRDGIIQAASILSGVISDHITVNLVIDYSGTGGGAAAGPDHGYYEFYSWVRSNLVNGATPGDTSFNALPSGSSIQSQTNVAVWNAQLKLWGVVGANDTSTDDGSATFATDINPNLLVGVALHELTHALGRVPYGPAPDIFDLFRFTDVGTRLFTGSIPAAAAYFSLDGGYTKLADYGRNSDPSDFLNSGVQGSADPFNEFYNGATAQHLTPIDLKQLDVLGFHLIAPDTQAPTLVHDSPLTVSAGATQAITSSLLSASDNVSSAAQLHYTVTTAPTSGTLLLSGVTTSSFTQADIDNGLLSYHETASGAVSDSFVFTVRDAAGNTTSPTSFQITVPRGVVGPVLKIADYNGDHHGDILWQNDDGTIAIWNSGQMAQAHTAASAGSIPSSSHIVGVGDFDANGQGDILWRDDNSAVFVWDNGNQANAHTLSAAGVVATSWHIAGTGDFDANGHDDILWQNTNGMVSIWDNGQINGAHVIDGSAGLPSSWHIVATGDFDGNGHDDILWYNDNGMVSIWDNGQIGRAHIIASGMPSDWHIVGAGDFDGNGHDDILWRNDNGTVAFWDNGQINQAHWVANPGTVASTTHAAGIGDFDGNGRADILWRDDNGATTIWDNGLPANAHTVAAAGTLGSGWHIV
jgi:Cadherin-like/FG-GAP-like repeat/FG-GAP repeat